MIKRIVTGILFFFLSTALAFADIHGWMGGFQFGLYDFDYTVKNQGLATPLIGSEKPNTKEGKYGGRFYMGYSFNDYFQAELGYTFYEEYKFKNVFGVDGAAVDLSADTYDIVSVVKLPLNDVFNVYAKLGTANINKSDKANSTAKALPLPAISDRSYRLTYGVGAVYNLNSIFSIDAGWYHINGTSSIKDTDFLFLGVVYYFEQFLRS